MTSLTSPVDRTESVDYRGKITIPPLTNDQLVDAVNDLLISDFVNKFPKVERLYADPPSKADQIYCLHSFIPASGATPDKDGVFGMMKCRGVYGTKEEADQRAEWLIRNVDSYHKILASWVGRPFPVCKNTDKWVKETSEIDIKKKATDVVSRDIRNQREEELKEIKEIKEREELLLEDVKRTEEPPEERYTVLRVKKAQLIYTYLETQKKMDQMKTNIIKAREEIDAMDLEDSNYRLDYFERYMTARRQAGLAEQTPDSSTFMNYLGEDAEDLAKLGF